MKSLYNSIFICLSWVLFLESSKAQSTKYLYQQKNIPIHQRVDDLMKRMNAEEKFMQLFMLHESKPLQLNSIYRNGVMGMQYRLNFVQKNDSTKNELEIARAYKQVGNQIQQEIISKSRWGIPTIFFEESLHGLCSDQSTIFPQAIALAASFDTSLMNRVAQEMAFQARRRGIRQVLSPVVNLATDVRWGRTEETYGEDPYLSACMGAAFVHAFESNGVITTPKHFIVNVGDGGRDSYPIFLSEDALYETHLQPFIACFNAGARSLMAAYNSYNGEPCSANDYLLKKVIRHQLNFKGLVISDAGAVGGANVLHQTSNSYPLSAKKSIESGLDVILQTDIQHTKLFNPYFLQAKVNAKDFDNAVRRVLTTKMEIGLFDQAFADTNTIELNDKAIHDLAHEAAIKSIVLLRNENQVLPISAEVKKILICGPDADEMRCGGYSAQHTPLKTFVDAMRSQSPTSVQIEYIQACNRNSKDYIAIPDSCFKQLELDVFSNPTFDGPPIIHRNEKNVNFQYTWNAPLPNSTPRFYSIRYTGYLFFPKSGNVQVGIRASDGYHLTFKNHQSITSPIKKGYSQQFIWMNVNKGDSIPFELTFSECKGNAKLEMIWSNDDSSERESINNCIEKSKTADLVIFAGGIEEGEFQDRSSLHLPGKQEYVLRNLQQHAKALVLISMGGSAIIIPPDCMPHAHVHAWYPGESGAEALADILWGKENPSGKLPITFPISEGQLPLSYYHHPTGRGDDYFDLSGEAMYPFGFGLSYSNFKFHKPDMDTIYISKNKKGTFEINIENMGAFDGDEVVQLYVHTDFMPQTFPIQMLRQFKRIHLAAHTAKKVTFTLSNQTFAIGKNKIYPGFYEIQIGASSRDIRQRVICKLLD